MRIAEDAPADREYGRGMPLEEAAERRLIAMGKEAVEQLPVRKTEQGAMVEQSIERGGRSERVGLELVCRHQCSRSLNRDPNADRSFPIESPGVPFGYRG
jgi:hypothetical protein